MTTKAEIKALAAECSGEHDSIEEIIGCDACAKLLDALTDDDDDEETT